MMGIDSLSNMQKLVYIIVSFILLSACADSGKERVALDAAQAIINDRPDSALAMLDSLEPSSQGFSQASLRRWQLLRLMAQNKCDTVFRSDSLQLLLTDYYDHHGTPNERMLGRAYHDMGEAPMAQKAFHDAMEKADTSSDDCDYWNLCRVYFQLSDLYYQSMLPKQMLNTLNLAQAYAEKAGDTLSSISAIGKKTLVYELSDKPDSLIFCAEEASNQFLLHGQKELSYQYLSIAIPFLVQRGDVAKASAYISLFENNSGYFDDNHNIQEGREIYYFTKGLYYLELEKPDSAEWMFRKLLHLAKNFNDMHAAYQGLRNKFRITGPVDSMAKYAILSEQFNDSLFLSSYRADLQKNEQMYNFTRYLEKSHKYKLESNRRKNVMTILSLLLILFILSSIVIYTHKKVQHKMQLLEYKNKINLLHQLKASKDTELLNKDKEIENLTSQIKELQSSSINKEIKDDLDNILLESAIVKKIIDVVNHPQKHLSNDDWNNLDLLFAREYPNFHLTLCTKHRLNEIEYRICQLVRINISPSSISTLLGYDYSYATTIRKRLLFKILHETGKPKQFDNYLYSIPRM